MKTFFEKSATLFLAVATLFVFGCSSDEASEQTSEEDGAIIGVNFKEEPKISYVLPRYLSAQQTRTISEVITGDEEPMGRLILRSQPNKRAGMYFFIMFGYAPDEIGLACTFELSVDTNMQPRPQTYVFTVPQTHSVLREVMLGVTGKDWLSPEERVNAWKLIVKSPSGKVLVEKQSWLWSAVEKQKINPQAQKLKEIDVK